ncbi:MAG: hypothetical protein LM590_06135 [Thermofilum sp.]|jgi:FtsH-binding integral membrane protein|nr:hypothetical protein [Thermofilum sp.]
MIEKAMSEKMYVKEEADLAELALRLRKYLDTVYGAHVFLAVGTLITSYWLIMAAVALAFKPTNEPAYWITAFILMWGLVPIAVRLAAPQRERAYPVLKQLAAWAPPFIIIYSIAGVLASSPADALRSLGVSLLVGGTAWYLALSICLLANHFLFEREAYRKGLVVAKPFLISGAITLATSPLVYFLASRDLSAGNFMAMGLMLLSYTCAAFTAIWRAYRWLQSA